MKIEDIRAIRGPSIYHHKPVLIMTRDLQQQVEVHSAMIPGFTDHLLNLLPGLRLHRCSPGYPGGFIERLNRGTYFAHIVEHLALELSSMAGMDVGYGKTVWGGRDGLYNVIVRYDSEEAMTYLLQCAVELAAAAANTCEYPVAEKVREAQRLVSEHALGPSTQAIVDAAIRWGIPWTRLNDMSLIQFGYGRNRRLIQATTTDRTADIAVDIAQDKELTKRMLSAASIRVPRGEVVRTEADALAVFERMGGPVALKPADGHHGQGVCLNLSTPLEVANAFKIAAKFSEFVIVEEFVTGKDYRVLVVGGRMVAASERIPAHVIGDGERTIQELVELENQNPLRGDGHEKPMTKITIDDVSIAYLAKLGCSLNAAPAKGQPVFLKETANMSTGGLAVDVTDCVHPEIRFLFERAARLVGLDICGVDLMAADISQPINREVGIVEVNAGPGIRMHVFPARGKPRDVGGAIMEMMYPKGTGARIPIISVTGTNGKTTVARMIAHVLGRSGQCVGLTSTDGIYVGGVKGASGDTTGPISARTVLSDPSVDVAVLETARGGLIRRGLGYDWADVGVITNVRADHIGQDGIESVAVILHIKSLVAERVREGGQIVLNGDDPLLVGLATQLAHQFKDRQLTLFSLTPDNPAVRKHIQSGGAAYFVEAGWIVEARSRMERRLIHAAEVPLTLSGTAEFQTANCMAALAACVGQGVAYGMILSGLRSFRPIVHNKGRVNLYKYNSGYVMVDYGHNPDAFQAICAMTARWNAGRVTGVIGVPGDRSDSVIRDAARAAARGFDRVIIRDDVDLRGRQPGEAPRLLCKEIRKHAPEKKCEVILNEVAAMERGLTLLGERDVLVIFYDEMYIVRQVLDSAGATAKCRFSLRSPSI